MASQLCQRLSTNPKLRADSDELTESFMAYEDLAIELLDAVRESDDAAPLLTLMPWEWTAGKGKGNVGRELLWKDSPLDSSSMEDGMLSLPCMRFVAHRHCQYTLDKYFAGDYPGSKARIRHSATLVGIALQSLLPFLPGTIVEVMPVVEKPNSKLKGEEVEKEYQSQLGDGEMDPDLIDAIDAVAHAGEAAAAETAEALEGTLEDMVGDLSSWRWLHFYSVPKVKFTLTPTLTLILTLILTLTLTLTPRPHPHPHPTPTLLLTRSSSPCTSASTWRTCSTPPSYSCARTAPRAISRATRSSSGCGPSRARWARSTSSTSSASAGSACIHPYA
jgi:hypothetical protein